MSCALTVVALVGGVTVFELTGPVLVLVLTVAGGALEPDFRLPPPLVLQPSTARTVRPDTTVQPVHEDRIISLDISLWISSGSALSGLPHGADDSTWGATWNKSFACADLR